MGYSGPPRGRQMVKAFIIGQWRWLFHIVVTVFGNKKGGYDDMSPELMCIMMSLIYNKPYSISGYIFRSYASQITRTARSIFLLYPRFTMLIIRYCIPNFPVIQGNIHVNLMGPRGYNAMFSTSSRRKDGVKPEEVDLFGCVVDPNYESPPNDGWLDDPEEQLRAEQRLRAQQPQPQQEQPPQAQPQQQQLQQQQQQRSQQPRRPQQQRAQQQQQPSETAVAAPEPQELINDVLNQDSHPAVVEELLHDVLVQHDDATDPDLVDIDQYIGAEDVGPEVARPEGTRDQTNVAGPSVPSRKEGFTASDSESTDTDEELQFVEGTGKRKLIDEETDEDIPPLQTRRKRVRTSTPALNIGNMPVSNEAPPSVAAPPAPRPTAYTSETSEKEQALVTVSPKLTATAARQSRIAARDAEGLAAQVFGAASADDTPLTEAQQLLSLQLVVVQLANTVSGLSTTLQTVVAKNADLERNNADLENTVNIQGGRLEALEKLVADLQKSKSAQGESCKEDELRSQQRDDKDDDPDTQKEKESEPTGPSQTGEQAQLEGESGSGAAEASESGVGEAGEKTT